MDDGSGQPRQIVCGAKNYKVGDKVPLALPGAVLPSDLKIKASKLRGVESQGMLCSAKELGLAEDAAGLLILSPEAKIGAPIANFSRTTRSSMSRSRRTAPICSAITAWPAKSLRLTEKPLRRRSRSREPATATGDVVRDQRAERVPVLFRAPDREHHGRPEPGLVARQARERSGMRSINNIVDITNFVMLEIGQPLHAFDADKLEGGDQCPAGAA